MTRRHIDSLEGLAHEARVRFIKHELDKGLDMARVARTEKSIGNSSNYQSAKAHAAKTHRDFKQYLSSVSGRLTAVEEEQLEANLQSLANALQDLD